MNAEWRQRQDMIKALNRIATVLEGVEKSINVFNEKMEVFVDIVRE